MLLEHDLREATINASETISHTISANDRVNCPIAALFGDAQRYQGTNLTWPVVGPTGFNPSPNPIIGSIA